MAAAGRGALGARRYFALSSAQHAAINNVGWLEEYHGLIQANRDPPKTFEELQAGVGLGRPGYDDHHIVEQSWGQWGGLTRDDVDDPSLKYR